VNFYGCAEHSKREKELKASWQAAQLCWSCRLPAHFETHAHSYSPLSPFPGARHKRLINPNHAEKQRELNGKHHFFLLPFLIFSVVFAACLKHSQKAESWNKATEIIYN